MPRLIPVEYPNAEKESIHHLVASNGLSSRSIIREDQKTKECTHSNCNHDQTIVGHEKQPGHIGQPLFPKPIKERCTHMMKKL